MKTNTTALNALMKQAWEGKVWVPLGYSTIAEWLKEGVGISRARGYQLLAIAKLEERLRLEIALPAEFLLSDTATRLISQSGTEEFITSLKQQATSDPQQNDVLVARLTQELRLNSQPQTVTPVITPAPVVSDEREAAVVHAFVTHVNNLPHPEEITEYDSLVIARNTLKAAIGAAQNVLNNYDKENSK